MKTNTKTTEIRYEYRVEDNKHYIFDTTNGERIERNNEDSANLTVDWLNNGMFPRNTFIEWIDPKFSRSQRTEKEPIEERKNKPEWRKGWQGGWNL